MKLFVVWCGGGGQPRQPAQSEPRGVLTNTCTGGAARRVDSGDETHTLQSRLFGHAEPRAANGTLRQARSIVTFTSGLSFVTGAMVIRSKKIDLGFFGLLVLHVY